ncbi:hypothetical protein niasHT_031966 [Heterodera trifolii]|uniref:Uncharacterized protein n=1 Tax=Heterodera trifolii TaxID=157864 RepID=A0ABD2HUS5_9BILA
MLIIAVRFVENSKKEQRSYAEENGKLRRSNQTKFSELPETLTDKHVEKMDYGTDNQSDELSSQDNVVRT